VIRSRLNLLFLFDKLLNLEHKSFLDFSKFLEEELIYLRENRNLNI
jgi:hypothetical protein